MRQQRDTYHVHLADGVTQTASFSKAPAKVGLDHFTELVVTLQVTAAVHVTNATYDFYVTTGDENSAWDLVHFSQIAAAISSTPTTFTARITSQNTIPQTVTTASPGVAANESATIQTDTAGSNQGIKTLTAGMVRHAPWGYSLGYELVVAGAEAGKSITYSIEVSGR